MNSQVLDLVKLLDPLGSYYNAACEDWLVANPGKTTRLNGAQECVEVTHGKAMTPRNIQNVSF